MIRQLATGVAVAAALALTPAAPAYADVPQPSAAFVGAIVASGDTAYVMIRYTCTSVVTPGNHLFVAVKQGPDVNTTNQSGSAFAQSFYSTNWMSDEGPNALTCDGKSRTQRVVVKPDIYWAPHHPGAPALSSGTALAQICVFDNITAIVNGEPVGGFAPSYTMERVIAAGR